MPNRLDHQGLVLSADLKQRFKWTIQLHERFVDAVIQLGGADTEATPKSVMRLMGVPGLTLYHLKSHLQKYRLAKNGNTSTANDDKKQVEADDTVVGSRTRADKSPLQLNGTMMQIQVDAQQKLQVQIERT